MAKIDDDSIISEVGLEHFYRNVETQDLIKNNNYKMTKIYKSKTVWFNIIMLMVGILAMPEFVAILPPIYLQYAVFASAIGNYVLRVFFTDAKIA